jgi:hypothetical protein
MRKIAVILSAGIAVAALLALTLSIASAAPSAPAQGEVEFTKEASNLTPRVGEAFTFTLRFSSACTRTFLVGVSDPNPAASYLRILTQTITATMPPVPVYSSTIGGIGPEGILWTGLLTGSDVISPTPVVTVTYQMQVTGIPTMALAAGLPVTNTATMTDASGVGSLPLYTAEAAIRIMPQRLFLPLVCRNFGG